MQNLVKDDEAAEIIIDLDVFQVSEQSLRSQLHGQILLNAVVCALVL